MNENRLTIFEEIASANSTWDEYQVDRNEFLAIIKLARLGLYFDKYYCACQHTNIENCPVHYKAIEGAPK